MATSSSPESQPGTEGPQGAPTTQDPVTYDEITEGSGISQRVWKQTTDLQYWDEQIDITQGPSDKEITTYFARCLYDYIYAKMTGPAIALSLQTDFEGWTKYQFNQVHKAFLREVVNRLLADGMTKGKGSFADQLVRLLDEGIPELDDNRSFRQHHLETKESSQPPGGALLQPQPYAARPNLQPQRSQAKTPLPSTEPQTTPPYSTDRDHQYTPEAERQRPPSAAVRAPLTTPVPQAVRFASPGMVYSQEVETYPRDPRDDPIRSVTPHEAQAFDLPPTRSFHNGPVSAQLCAAFKKHWDPSLNYTGKQYDILFDKTKHFIAICRRVGITEDQYHGVFPMILKEEAQDFHLNFIGPEKRWDEVYNLMDQHFNTNTNHAQYYSEWSTITFNRVRSENPDKTLLEVLEVLLKKLRLVQKALGNGFQGESALHAATRRAISGVEALAPAMVNLKPTCEGMFGDLRSALQVHAEREELRRRGDAFYVDRKYNSKPPVRFGARNPKRGGYPERSPRPDKATPSYDKKRCFVCRKEGCWSTNHDRGERDAAKRQYLAAAELLGKEDEFSMFLVQFEGKQDHSDPSSGEESDDETETAQWLANCAFLHRSTGEDIYSQSQETSSDQFILDDHYSTRYQGILWDTGAAKVSTVGKQQVEAFVRENPDAEIDWTPGGASIRFGGNQSLTAIGSITIETPLGRVQFQILEAPTPFLLSLYDADRLKAYFNNIRDVIVQESKGITIPVVRKWGHPFFHTSKIEAGSYFTEEELRRLHRRFGHPRTERLYKMLKAAGYDDVQSSILEEIERFCHHCQTHDPSPQRFKFTIKDDRNFNFEVVVDVVQLNGRQALHVIDSSTSFQAATFLKSLSARDTWNALCKCWIHVYQGPPDYIVHDPGTNFASEEFRTNARIVGITCREMPVEAHWTVGKVERAHGPLRRAYDILSKEIGHCTDDETILQMTVKALNDTAGPDGLVPTLLVFGAYPRINADSPPSPEITERAEAIRKAMKMLRGIRSKVEINRAINTRNGPRPSYVLSLPLQSEVMVWRESRGWTGPYKIQSIEGNDIVIDTGKSPTKFRWTQVKPYYRQDQPITDKPADTPNPVEKVADEIIVAPIPEAPEPRRRGRRRTVVPSEDEAFLSRKEESDYALAVKLRQDGIITTPGDPFQESDAAEIDGLAAQGVFEFVRFDHKIHGTARIFKTRLVREIKGKGTKPYEKSRLVVQGYDDKEKKTILTQSPTIQRMSQRMILALGPSLIKSFHMQGELRDISQAYTQSQDKLNREIFARLPKEIESEYPSNTIFKIVRPLYGLAESGLYWFKTYLTHHQKELSMESSTYDPCLLFTAHGPDFFGITGLQTDDTISFVTANFSRKEEEKLQAAQFRAKPKTVLDHDQPIEFNGGRIQLEGDEIAFVQKGQVNQLRLVDLQAADRSQQYVAQRARGAYIASICQPEAAFDLSTAAQVKEPGDKDIKDLNARLQWQLDHPDRGLRYIPLDLNHTKLFIFTDGSFANNSDLSSQLGYIIVLGTEARTYQGFELFGNVVHWNSSKCKRITRSVLASELYGMVAGFDSAIALSTTLRRIIASLGTSTIPIVVCSDSKSLYDCLVKLGTTQEKRLMIDIMSLREAYERREISDIRWIDGRDNPADACTKKTPNAALGKLISANHLKIRMEAFVERNDQKV